MERKRRRRRERGEEGERRERGGQRREEEVKVEARQLLGIRRTCRGVERGFPRLDRLP